MEEVEIKYKFKIIKRISNSRNLSGNDSPFVNTFKCANCCNKLDFTIRMYSGGCVLSNLYKKNSFIEKNELLENKVANIADKHYSHLGELAVDRLPAFYSSVICSDCNSHYLTVFGSGETQPSRDEMQITGIWEIKKTTPNKPQ